MSTGDEGIHCPGCTMCEPGPCPHTDDWMPAIPLDDVKIFHGLRWPWLTAIYWTLRTEPTRPGLVKISDWLQRKFPAGQLSINDVEYGLVEWHARMIAHRIWHRLFGRMRGCSCSRCFNHPRRRIPNREIYDDRVYARKRLDELDKRIRQLERRTTRR